MFDSVRGHTIIGPLLGSAPTVLDLGANHGVFSKVMSERFGGTYYMAEANPALASALANEKPFHAWHCAVAAEEGTVEFHLATHDDCSSVLPLSGSGNGVALSSERVTVAARSLESLLVEMHASRVDLIKMDIEGMEAPVLMSLSTESLQKIGQITVEFHCDERFGLNIRSEVQQSIRYLRDNGFLFLNFSGTTLMDVLFVNRRLHGIPYWKGRVWELAGVRPPWLRTIRKFVPENLRLRLNQSLDRIAGRKRDAEPPDRNRR